MPDENSTGEDNSNTSMVWTRSAL